MSVDRPSLMRHDERVSPMSHTDRTARRTALLSGLTLAIGVAVFAFRTAHTVMGDGEVSAVGVLASGLVLLVVPIAAVWRLLASASLDYASSSRTQSCAQRNIR
jgi:hypothetical protein